MSPEQFVYWLHGYTEMTGGKEPTLEQWKMIRDHLKTVFTKVTPEIKINTNPDLDWQEMLRTLHKEFKEEQEIKYCTNSDQIIC